MPVSNLKGPTGASGPATDVYVGTTAPTSPTDGMLWWDTDDAAVLAVGATGPTGATVTGPTGPSGTGPTGATVTGPTGPTGGTVTGPTGIGFTTCATGTQTSVTGAAADTQLLAANANRRGTTVDNDSTAVLYLLLADAVSSTTNYTVKVAAAGYIELPYAYTGKVKGIWAGATGAARVTEFT